MSEPKDPTQTPEMKSKLRAAGREMRARLVGKAYAEKLDREVYTNRHMEKFAEYTQEVLFAQMWNRPVLDLKVRSLVTVITDVTSGMTAALGLHVRFCRIHGWSEDEITEAIIHCVGYIGVPLTRQALLVAVKVFDEMNAEGPAVSEAR